MSDVGIVRTKRKDPFRHRTYYVVVYYVGRARTYGGVHVVIVYNLALYREAVRQYYAGLPARHGVELLVEFEDRQISLNIPEEGVTVEGWTITPSDFPTIITKEEVDMYEQGRLPSIRLFVEWKNETEPLSIVHQIELLGARQRSIYFAIELPPGPNIQQTSYQYQPIASPQGKSHSFPQSPKPNSFTGSHSIGASASPVEVVAAGDTELSPDDLCDVGEYLLSMERTQMYHLGLVLGLSYKRVKPMTDSDTFVDDVIDAWLNKEDSVERKGVPSWRTLVRGLRRKRVDRDDIADKIAADFGIV